MGKLAVSRQFPQFSTYDEERCYGGQTGEVIECSEGKRVTVRFANGRLIMGRDAKLFERI
jgi:hypothetical protein